MRAIILAGGYGTRLSEETDTIPKPMIEIGGKPLLWHLMKSFSQFEIKDFIVALGYKGEVIKQFFLDYPSLQSDLRINLATGAIAGGDVAEDWQLELVDTGPDTMTGGRLRRLQHLVSDTFLFTYGDGLSDVDINALLAFHRSHGRLATVTAVKPRQRFGLLRINDHQQVTNFAEKPDAGDMTINGGFFVLEPGVFDYIDGDASVWEQGPCENLARDGQLMAYRHDGFWQCVDTLHELRQLRQLWDQGEAGWKTW